MVYLREQAKTGCSLAEFYPVFQRGRAAQEYSRLLHRVLGGKHEWQVWDTHPSGSPACKNRREMTNMEDILASAIGLDIHRDTVVACLLKGDWLCDHRRNRHEHEPFSVSGASVFLGRG